MRKLAVRRLAVRRLTELLSTASLSTQPPVPVLPQTSAHPLAAARCMGYITLSNELNTISSLVVAVVRAGGEIVLGLRKLPLASGNSRSRRNGPDLH